MNAIVPNLLPIFLAAVAAMAGGTGVAQRGDMATTSTMLVGLISVVSLSGCGVGGGTYCQSGPKYGTQCYSAADTRDPYVGFGQPHPNDPPNRKPKR